MTKKEIDKILSWAPKCRIYDCKLNHASGHTYCQQHLLESRVAKWDAETIQAIKTNKHHRCANCDVANHLCWCGNNHD